MNTFLLEIGTEELPADFARLVVSQLEGIVSTDLAKSLLKYKKINCSSTPRRICVLVSGVPDKAEDFIEERKGPPASQAFSNGEPAQAAIGFAKRCNVSTDSLDIRDTPKGSFVFAKVIEKGKPSKELFVEMIPKWIHKLQGRRFMRWGKGEIRFSRPIRWLVALLDSEVLNVKIEETDPKILSSNISQGHRLIKTIVPITAAINYQSILKESGVIVSRNERSKLIKLLVQKESNKLNGLPGLTDQLLDELTDIVELPSLVVGEFDKSFLELPPEVLSKVMCFHQRYIPIYSNQYDFNPLALDSKDILLPFFLSIANGLDSANSNIKKGNERVINARFADAKFFLKADRSLSSENRTQQLKNVTFADGLGTLFERIQRMQWLSELIISNLEISNEDAEYLRKATYLSKNDLVSQMVSEFPELQGIIGSKYLLYEGQSRAVALAVLEQYLPRTSNDPLPKSIPGTLLALVERIELLLSIFSKGERPSGSSDPYALKRAGNGIVQILWNNKFHFDLFAIIFQSAKYWSNLFPDSKVNSHELSQDLSEFFRQRIISLFEDLNYDSDLIQAICGHSITINTLLINVLEVRDKAELLSEMRASGQLAVVQSVVSRASNLADKSSLPLDVLSCKNIIDTDLFEKESEFKMLEVINSLEPLANSNSNDKYKKLANGLVSGASALSAFFDGDKSVMVMVEDEMIRKNRLNLLALLRNQARVIADFKFIN